MVLRIFRPNQFAKQYNINDGIAGQDAVGLRTTQPCLDISVCMFKIDSTRMIDMHA